MSNLIDEIRKALKGEKKSEFIDQLLKEKSLYDALKKTGITIEAEDTRERAVLRPYGVLSKVQKIDQIDVVELINKISEITTLKTLETLSEVTKIKNIENIKSIGNAPIFQNPVRNPFFLSGLSDWSYQNVTLTEDDNFHYHATINSGYLMQYLTAKTDDYDTLVFWGAKPMVGGVDVDYIIAYTDGTSTSGTQVLGTTWSAYPVNLPTGKIIKYIRFENSGGTSGIAFPQLLPSLKILNPHPVSQSGTWNINNLLNPHPITQTTRTNLRTMGEREDLLLKSQDVSAGTTTILSAVSGQRHKIYGYDYEADTDGTNEFLCTVNGTTCRFGRRTTKGVHAKTFVHPIVCDVNTALQFVSAGNTKLSIQYKTEA